MCIRDRYFEFAICKFILVFAYDCALCNSIFITLYNFKYFTFVNFVKYLPELPLGFSDFVVLFFGGHIWVQWLHGCPFCISETVVVRCYFPSDPDSAVGISKGSFTYWGGTGEVYIWKPAEFVPVCKCITGTILICRKSAWGSEGVRYVCHFNPFDWRLFAGVVPCVETCSFSDCLAKLPRLTLPTFDGHLPEFYSKFITLVHDCLLYTSRCV